MNSLDEWPNEEPFNLFSPVSILSISTSSPFSFPSFHSFLKDTELVSTDWTPPPTSTRVIKFVHPLAKNPVGPSSTHVTKTQTLTSHSKYLTLKSSSIIHDVPSSGAFKVEEVLIAREVEGGTEITVLGEVEWKGWSAIKGIVNRSTEKEVREWWRRWVEEVGKFLEKR